jgi:peroxiredoxin
VRSGGQLFQTLDLKQLSLDRKMIKDLHTLPTNLPVPVDDGACEHLLGSTLPSVSLTSTTGKAIDLSTYAGTLVIYFFPMLGRPDSPPFIGWNDIPGARGCTPQTCAFRDLHAELKQLGVEVFGVSAQNLDDQQEAHARLQLPFVLLNDGQLALAQALKLPTFEYAGKRLIKRLTIIATGGLIRKVFYPVFPPNNNAGEVIAWLTANA